MNGIKLVAWTAALGLLACGDSAAQVEPPTCDDGVMNGDERDVDCGGPTCGACAIGDACVDASDCVTATCGADGRCGCPVGFAPDGAGGCEDVDDCAASPCANGGACVDGVDAFTCTCQPGFSGPTCATVDSACADVTCDNGGTCVDEAGGGFRCDCAAGFWGDDCGETCAVGKCAPGTVTCGAGGGGRACTACVAGWTGAACEDDVDECDTGADDCAADAVCTNTDGGFDCACPVGASGDGRTCTPCAAGTWGDACGEECEAGECVGTIACDPVTGDDAACEACVDGWRGTACDQACDGTGCVDGAATCAQDGSDRVCTLGCLAGLWGDDCGATCVAEGCDATAGDVACAQDTGATVSCAGCVPGRSGADCQAACAQGTCLGTVACAQDDPSSGRSCPGGCVDGRWGPACDSVCGAPDCIGGSACHQTTGAVTSCVACPAGRWGAACQSTCSRPAGCTGTVTCDKATGAAEACDGCVAGRWGATCAGVCDVSGCDEGAFCDRVTGVPQGCGTCEPGKWGPTCAQTCTPDDDCAGVLTCDRVTGQATACEGCAPGRWGAACASTCAQGQCVGTVTCAQASGQATSCGACTNGYWGPTCASSCAQGDCTGTVTCDKSTGQATSCPACVSGRWGTTCASSCPQGDCVGTVTCSKSIGQATSCTGCDPGHWGTTCASSCPQAYCVGTVTCDQSDGQQASCTGCVSGRWGPTCASSCPQGQCVGTVTCAQSNGAVAGCTGCADGYWGAVCGSTCDAGNCAVTMSCAQATGAPTGCPECEPGWQGDVCDVYEVGSCLEHLAGGATTSGVYTIDPDGPDGAAPYDVYCDMTTLGGGWTLVLTTSDDGAHTWTWDARALLVDDTTAVGALEERHRDFKSPAYHDLLARDLLFVHQPSGVTAQYADVGDGTQDLGAIIGAYAVPVCDYGLAGNGFPLTGGTLTATGSLCDTDLYFNVGDHETSLANCQSLTGGYANATFGPAWSAGYNNGCPFDDASSSGIGPSVQCELCPPGHSATETAAAGFGTPAGLNTGASGGGANHLKVFVREAVPCGASADCASALCIDGACRDRARSCLEWRKAGATTDGPYAIDPLGAGAFDVYCDMTGDGGGWTRVVNIHASTHAHGYTPGAYGNVATDAAAKLSDALINTLTTGGFWRFNCGGGFNAFVTNDAGVWISQVANGYNWRLDRGRDGTYENTANRSGYVFSDFHSQSAGHANYAATSAAEGTGCYWVPEGWGRSGNLWAR